MKHWKFKVGAYESVSEKLVAHWEDGVLSARNFKEALNKVQNILKRVPREHRHILSLELVSVVTK